MRLTLNERERLLDKTVRVVLAIRAQYLANGANALKHWQQIHDRLRISTATAGSVEEWVTLMCSGLRLPTPSKDLSSAMVELATEESCNANATQWLELMEREHAYVMALARAEAEDRKNERARAMEQGNG